MGEATQEPNGHIEKQQGYLQPPPEMQPVEKVKRKCGRPRNPIPRHKRDSHINAEHRRRGKIQECFQTLKTMVPRYTTDSGRNSKSNVLSNAVDHCRFLEREIKSLNSGIENTKAELAILRQDIGIADSDTDNFEPDYIHSSKLDQHFQYFITSQGEASTSWATNGIFLRVASRLFESYKQSVNSQSTASAFALSVAKWAINTISTDNLRKVCSASVESDVDEPYQASLVPQTTLSINDPIKPAYHSEQLRVHTIDSLTESQQLYSNMSDSQDLRGTGHDHQNSNFYENYGEVLSLTSDSSDCYLPPSEAPDSSISTRLSRDDHEYMPSFCPLNQCALKEMTSREFSSFTRRDALNQSNGDGEISFRTLYPPESCNSRRLNIIDHRHTMDAFHVPSSNLDIDLHERYGHFEPKLARFRSKRRYSVTTNHSYTLNSDSEYSSSLSHLHYDNEHNDYSPPIVPCSSPIKTIDKDFDYQPHHWGSKVGVLLPCPQTVGAEYNGNGIQPAHADSFNSPSRSHTVCGGPSSPETKITYSNKFKSKPGFQQAKLSPGEIDSETVLSAEKSFQNIQIAEEAREIHSLPRLEQNSTSCGTYLAQLLQAPLPKANSAQLIRRCSVTDQARPGESLRHTDANGPDVNFLVPPNTTYNQGQCFQHVKKTAHLSRNPNEIRGYSLPLRYYDARIEAKTSSLSAPIFINGNTNDHIISTSEETEIDSDTKNCCSDADCLSATCDLYRDAQGAIDMTFESLTHASGGRGQTQSNPCKAYTQFKIKSKHSSVSPLVFDDINASASDAVNATVTNPRMPETYPTSTPQTLCSVPMMCPLNNNSTRADVQITTSDASQLYSSEIQAIHKPVSDAQSDYSLNESNPNRTYCSTVGKSTSAAPVLKQRYLSQTTKTTVQVLKTPEIIPTSQSDTDNQRNNPKRPFCQPDPIQHKWKMRRLVLSGH